jgi:protein-S-isoprenylcysteine O-methyltransferase Ste14
MLYALLERRLTARLGRLRGGAAVGLASVLIFWLVVLPLKGSGIADLPPGEIAIDLAFDLVFGIGIALLYWAALHLGRRPLVS